MRGATTRTWGAPLAAVAGLAFAACAPAETTPATAEEPEPVPAATSGSAVSDLDRPLTEQVAAMERGAFTSGALVAGYLARIQARDTGAGGIHAVLLTDPAATTRAVELDRARGRGALLQGAAILVKDNIDTQGLATTAGSLALARNVPARDAFVVRKLREAHALVLGKTNLSEWANFRSTSSTSGWSSVGGQTYMGRNPVFDPCGSSSGSGAAMAAGLASATLGTETDGSIVCPASVNGVVGFKPTVGLVSRAGVVPISASQDTVGPIARTVRDAARVLSAIAGRDPDDPATAAIPAGTSLDFEAPLRSATLAGKRLGVVVSFGFGTEGNVFDTETARMQAAGATIVNVTMDVDSWGDDELTIMLHEFKAGVGDYLAAHPVPGQPRTLAELIAFDDEHAATVMPYFGQELFLQAQATAGLTAPAYLAAKTHARTASKGAIEATLARNHLDALIAPTMDPAWRIDYGSGDPPGLHSASSPAAVAGCPHLTVPMGTVDGLPCGCQYPSRS